jgi:hypothetical protein
MTSMDAEECYRRACTYFRERRFDEARKEYDKGLSQPDLVVERRIEFLLLRCDVLQAGGPIDWELVFSSAKDAKRTANGLEDPIRSLRQAQALNRMGVAIRARAVAEGPQGLDARISQLETAWKYHVLARGTLADLDADAKSSQLDQREFHSVIVSANNNLASVLVEKAHLYGTHDADKVKDLLEEALGQFSSCRYACDGLVPEARVATWNDEAEVLLRLSRICRQDSDLRALAFHRAHSLVAQALELLDGITDRRVRLTWEWLLREKTRWSMENDVSHSGQLARRLLEDSTAVNSARLAELSRLERVRYQIATVDVYYTPWSPSRGGGRTHDGSAEVRLERTLERLRQTFSDRHRLNTILLRDGWHRLHLEDLQVALDAAVELGEAVTICEVIETCRAQGYSAVPTQQARLAGDTGDSTTNRALAAIGIATVGLPPDLAVRGTSALRQFAEQTIDVDRVRQSTVGVDGWWWSLLRTGGALYWAVLTPDACYSGKCESTDDQNNVVPLPIVDELARRRRRDDPPLPLVISPSAGLGSVGWATLQVGEQAGHHLVRHADIRIAPPVPLLHACLLRPKRPKRDGKWPITLLVVADPLGNLSAQAELPSRVAQLMDVKGIILQSRQAALSTPLLRRATRANLRDALDQLRHRGSGGTMVYSGHGISHGPDPIVDFGLALDGEDKLTARDVIDRASDAEKPALPARVVLAACQTLGVGRGTHEWTSVAPAALFAGAEFVLATCRDLISDGANLDATVELCGTVCSSERPVAAVNSLQRSHLADSGPAPSHPSLFYSAIVGRGECDSGQE